MGEYRYRENVKRGMAFVLAIILGGMAFLPGFPVFPVKAAPASGQGRLCDLGNCRKRGSL